MFFLRDFLPFFAKFALKIFFADMGAKIFAAKIFSWTLRSRIFRRELSFRAVAMLERTHAMPGVTLRLAPILGFCVTYVAIAIPRVAPRIASWQSGLRAPVMDLHNRGVPLCLSVFCCG